jgi:peptidyl-prolyl cis-trans isomerase A (cyclophilin A)
MPRLRPGPRTRAALASALAGLAGHLGLATLAALPACSHDDAPAPTASASPTPGASSGPQAVSTAASASTAAATGTAAARNGDAPIYHPEKAVEKAPDTFKAKFSTTKGDFVIAVTRAWAPNGADRFYNLIKLGFYDGARFYRAIDGFMVQFGVNADPSVNGAWYRANIPDDPVVKSNTRGFVTFAMAGANSRRTEVFINYVDKDKRLDALGFAPFGEVVDGMKVVDSLYKGYGETAPKGKGPDFGRATREGEVYLAKEFPELDRITSAKLL